MLETKRKSFGRPLESEKQRRAGSDSFDEPVPAMPDPHGVGILPDSRNTSINEITPPMTRPPSFVPRKESTALGPIPEAGNTGVKVYVGKLGNVYMFGSIVAGQTDFLYGFGTLWIEKSRLLLRSCGGGITAWKGTNTTNTTFENTLNCV
ncbi:carbohydrate esterase family 8 protein [Pseudocercospora fijiensis CIRAD86]|uniref:Carbohydrate esterase family 8 protein n=1 Tax=Pseudocercospora fijiensis (strain CIRAD86) TaxID=383855 RepID=N1Q7H3_PSEFD|nr:carbohydrate esterase family 8 protein [Pseudocercospora fijiensis CIRAD86]EME88625.1 carbohydrate esterase family 8 protein [Pseudocercospora fijiensis CIRAD86]